MSDSVSPGDITQPLAPPSPRPFFPPISGPAAAMPNLGYPTQPAWMSPNARVDASSAQSASLAVEHETAIPVAMEVFAPSPPPVVRVVTGRPPPFWLVAWRKLGAGSLALSLLIHGGILLLAGITIVVTQTLEKSVDFLPGGGTTKDAEASQEVRHQVQQKKRRTLSKPLPLQKVVSTSINANISLPDAPADLLDLPDASSLLGASKVGAGGLGVNGLGSGFGSGFGSGAVQGFVGMTFFGKLGGEGMPGTFYDLKQTPERKPTGYTDSEAAYAEVINATANKKFAEATMKDFYKASQQMSFTFLAIPNMSANEGPKSFAVEKEVEPRAWFVHYTATIEPPEPGDYRFVGFFDDALIVYINNKPVLDASWYAIHDHGEKRRDPDIRQNFGGPMVAPGRHAYAGRWFSFKSPTRIDIVVGERPGGRVGGVLLIQSKKHNYKKRDDGTPILPVFAASKPDMADLTRLSSFQNGGVPFEISPEISLFKIRKSPFD